MRYNRFVKRFVTVLLLLGIIASLTGSVFLLRKVQAEKKANEPLYEQKERLLEEVSRKEEEIRELEEEKEERKAQSDALKETYGLWVHEIEKIQAYMS